MIIINYICSLLSRFLIYLPLAIISQEGAAQVVSSLDHSWPKLRISTYMSPASGPLIPKLTPSKVTVN